MTRRQKRDFHDSRRQELDRRQVLADLIQASIDREQALADSSQAHLARLTQRWDHAAMVQAVSDPGDRAAQRTLRCIARGLVEDQARHDLHQALLDQQQAATDTLQRLIDALQAELDAPTLAASEAQAVRCRGTRQRASVGRRWSRGRARRPPRAAH